MRNLSVIGYDASGIFVNKIDYVDDMSKEEFGQARKKLEVAGAVKFIGNIEE